MRSTSDDLKFLIDLLTTNEEKCFLAELEENPKDTATRNAYQDYLKENNREASAALVKNGFIPGSEKSYPPPVVDYSKVSVSPGQIISGSIGSGQIGMYHFANPHPFLSSGSQIVYQENKDG